MVNSLDLNALNIADLRTMARRRLPRGVFEFVERGAEDDVAIASNRSAFDRYRLLPAMLKDVSKRTLATRILGQPSALPFVLAPTGAAGLMWHDGELALARAAAAANIPFTLSTASLTSIERIAAESKGRLWFQLYMWQDRKLSHDLVQRVQAAGFEALVVTVDGTVSPNRECNVRNGFLLPFRVTSRNFVDIATHPRWLTTVIMRYLLTTGMPRFENFPEALRRSLTDAPKGASRLPKTDSLTWEDLHDLRRIWDGPLLVKGLLRADDAATALNYGADGIIVSNHGGRNLDYSIPPLFALPAIMDRVGGRLEVLMDGGIMRGSDAVKALALGAKAVQVGRAPLWGVAAAGEPGARRAISILADETLRILGQLGCVDVAELAPHHLWIEAQQHVPDAAPAAPIRAVAGG
jgi:isopentenyl diphosphate isomerase/L-lactate dehydrogenase-like FMN-dependent dehydrogenase